MFLGSYFLDVWYCHLAVNASDIVLPCSYYIVVSSCLIHLATRSETYVSRILLPHLIHHSPTKILVIPVIMTTLSRRSQIIPLEKAKQKGTQKDAKRQHRGPANCAR